MKEKALSHPGGEVFSFSCLLGTSEEIRHWKPSFWIRCVFLSLFACFLFWGLNFILMGKVNMLCPYIIARSFQRTSGFLMTFTQTLELSVAVRVPHAFFFFLTLLTSSHSLKTVASLYSSILERSTPRKIL